MSSRPRAIIRSRYWSIDKAGNIESPHTAVVQIDKTAPTLNVVLDKTTLWPPNHQLVTVKANVSTNDSLSGISSIVLTSITSNEPDNGLSDGDKSNDIQGAQIGTLDTEFMLRAEKSDNNNNKDNQAIKIRERTKDAYTSSPIQLLILQEIKRPKQRPSRFLITNLASKDGVAVNM